MAAYANKFYVFLFLTKNMGMLSALIYLKNKTKQKKKKKKKKKNTRQCIALLALDNVQK